MKQLFLDFETYYDDTYSLRKMTPVEYILDPRWETLGLAVKRGVDGKAFWVEGPDVQAFFDNENPVTCAVTFNALFDMCICAWRYNWRPTLMCDVMGVSRAVLGHVLRSHSLASVAGYLGVGVKGELKTKGMHYADIEAAGPAFKAQFVNYALNDADMTAAAFEKLVLSGLFPMYELLVMDMVLRTTTNPKFILEPNVLCTHLAQVQADKQLLIAQAGLQPDQYGKCPELMSNDKFAELLRNLGVTPPMKISKTTGKETYAFAKVDPGMIELEEHSDPRIQALVAARVGNKTTIEESRTQRFIDISRLTWLDNSPPLAPMPLRYGAAHTHRLGGDWKLNPQNLGRKSPIKKAFTCPPGHKAIAADAAQIEARGVAAVCGQEDLRAAFANGEDVYASFATEAFSYPVTKKTHPGERFIGKVNILQLGFGSGWFTLKDAIRVQSRSQLGQEMIVEDEDAMKYVNTYRRRYPRIPAAWKLLNDVGIPCLESGSPWTFGPCVFEKNAILLPSGLRLHYHNLRREGSEWWFDYAGKPEKLYGGKLLENIIQALARIITMYAAVRIQKQGLELALQVHDELTYVVPDEHVAAAKALIDREMSLAPSWQPDWPLAVEINVGDTYGDCK
ncbi:MAG: DNA polymerase [Ktedonobacterales bacterium]